MLHSLTTSIFSSAKGGIAGNASADKKPDELQKKPAADTKLSSVFGAGTQSAFTAAIGKPLNFKV
jgi:hypothetical protein